MESLSTSRDERVTRDFERCLNDKLPEEGEDGRLGGIGLFDSSCSWEIDNDVAPEGIIDVKA